MVESSNKLWGGRFRGKVDPIMNKFNESLSFDKRMYKFDILGSKAYVRALELAKVVNSQECEMIVNGLSKVEREWESGKFEVKPSDEDIHTANERRLSEIIGPLVGGKLHTGRSRNDQVATDLRLYLMQVCADLMDQLKELLSIATSAAEEYIEVLMPGFTHLQPAQPIRYSHWLMSHVAAMVRDVQVMKDAVLYFLLKILYGSDWKS